MYPADSLPAGIDVTPDSKTESGNLRCVLGVKAPNRMPAERGTMRSTLR